MKRAKVSDLIKGGKQHGLPVQDIEDALALALDDRTQKESKQTLHNITNIILESPIAKL
jgi:hypothetical protein